MQHTFYLGCNRKPIDKTIERAIEAAENKYIETLSGFKTVSFSLSKFVGESVFLMV